MPTNIKCNQFDCEQKNLHYDIVITSVKHQLRHVLLSFLVCFFTVMQDLQAVPLANKLQALQLLDLRDRSVEEQKRIIDDIRCTLQYFAQLHNIISAAVDSYDDASERAILLQKLYRLELYMPNLWRVAAKHCSSTNSSEPLEQMPSYFSTDCVVSAATYATEHLQASDLDELDSDDNVESDDD
jgi:hypothetical protein